MQFLNPKKGMNTYYVPGAGETSVNKTDKVFMCVYGGQTSKQVNYKKMISAHTECCEGNKSG